MDGLPDVLKLGRVAECVATVHNRSGRPMTLQLQFRTDGMVGVYVHGQSFRNLGQSRKRRHTSSSVRWSCLVLAAETLTLVERSELRLS